MPELRHDPIVDRWVIIAQDRAQRPGALVGAPSTLSAAAAGVSEVCPFCPGNEAETPPEVFAVRNDGDQANSPHWRVRVVPNKYPALVRKTRDNGDRRVPLSGDFGARRLFDSEPGFGVHEVIVDTPRHVTRVGALTDDELADSLLAIRARLWALREERDLKHALVFKNVGHAAGATREHIHSQLMASQLIPPLVAGELRGAERFFRKNRECVFCRMIADERELGVRIVGESAAFVALCPFASRFPYEMWILPQAHSSDFDSTGSVDLADLASLARSTIARIETLSSPLAYNLVIHTSPFDSLAVEHYHWHMEVFPRLTVAAGFEWGSGCAVNPISPEDAAGVLRTIVKGSA
jgi:UDPglucose--hexose-1-phosphate uridylyltransferase